MTPEEYNARFNFSISPEALANERVNTHILLSKSLRFSHTFQLYAEILASFQENAVFLPFEAQMNDEKRISLLMEEFRQNPMLQTIMVSDPFKRTIRPHLNRFTERALIARAVNLIMKTDSGIVGDNLDGLAFEHAITELDHVSLKSRSMLFLGCGGVSSAVAVLVSPLLNRIGISDSKEDEVDALRDLLLKLRLNIPIDVVRTDSPRDLTAYDVIYNGTGVGKGTAPDAHQQSPLSDDEVTYANLFIDANYIPKLTKFLQQGISRGAQVVNGLSHMLASTALHCGIIVGQRIPLSLVADKYKEIQGQQF